MNPDQFTLNDILDVCENLTQFFKQKKYLDAARQHQTIQYQLEHNPKEATDFYLQIVKNLQINVQNKLFVLIALESQVKRKKSLIDPEKIIVELLAHLPSESNIQIINTACEVILNSQVKLKHKFLPEIITLVKSSLNKSDNISFYIGMQLAILTLLPLENKSSEVQSLIEGLSNTQFKKLLSHPFIPLKVLAINFLDMILFEQEFYYESKYELYKLDIIQAYEDILNSLDLDSIKDASLALSQILDGEDNFFKQNTIKLYQKVFAFIEKQLEKQLIINSTFDILFILVDKYARIIFRKKEEEEYEKLLDLLLRCVRPQKFDQIPEKWLKPDEGFSMDFDQDLLLNKTFVGLKIFDKIYSIITEQQVFKAIKKLAVKYCSSQDLLDKITIIMGISQIGEYLTDIDDPLVYEFTAYLLQSIDSENPLLRFSAIHCIGQLSDDLKPTYQQKTYQHILPKLIEKLNDPVLRIQSHAAAAITNYIEEIDQSYIENFGSDIYNKTLALTSENSISIVKENALTTLSCLAQLNSILSKEQVVFLIKQVLITMLSQHNKQEYKQLRGQIIEAMTIALYYNESSLDLELFKEVVNIMLQTNFDDTEPNSISIDYLLMGWYRILISKSFKPLLSQTIQDNFEYFFKILYQYYEQFAICQKFAEEYLEYIPENALSANLSFNETQQVQQTEININENKDALEYSLYIMTKFLQYSPITQAEKIKIVTTKYIKVLKKFINEEELEKIFQNTKIIDKVISQLKRFDVQLQINFGNKVINGILDKLKAFNFDSIDEFADIISVVQDTFQAIGQPFLNDDGQKTFLKMVKQCAKLYQKNYGKKEKGSKDKEDANKNDKEQDGVEEQEEDEEKDKKKKDENEFEDSDSSEDINNQFDNFEQEDEQIIISEMIITLGNFIKCHPTTIIPEIDKFVYLISDMIEQKGFEKGGLFLLCDILDFCPLDGLYEKFLPFIDQVIALLKKGNPTLSQAASYGIGLYSQKYSKDKFKDGVQQKIIAGLAQAYQSKSQNAQILDDDLKYALDNIISAIFKFIKNQDIQNKFELFMFWSKNVPLTTDKEESFSVSKIFCQILQENEEIWSKINEFDKIKSVLEVLDRIIQQYLSGSKYFQKKSSAIQQQIQAAFSEVFKRLLPDQFQIWRSAIKEMPQASQQVVVNLLSLDLN